MSEWFKELVLRSSGAKPRGFESRSVQLFIILINSIK